mgnify:CR=1 FL=1|jgi:hypothetical protein
MPLLILSLVIQLALVIHILKTGRNMSWVFIVLFFPLVGTLAYVIVELVPEWTGSRTGVTMRRKLSRLANPDRDLKQASQQFAVADTVQNTMALADQCLAKERYAEAAELYQRALRGVHADDPVLLYGLARAKFGMGDAAGTVAALDLLKERNPGHTTPEGHLLYARAREALGDIGAAVEEYESLVGYYPGPEPACRLASILKRQGRDAEARELFQKVLDQSRIAGRHYNSIHKEWVEMARREA